jgi:hypothetical protein
MHFRPPDCVATWAVLLLCLPLAACGGGSGGGSSGGGGGSLPALGVPVGPDIRVSTDTPGSALSLYPAVCCNGNNIYAAWYDGRNGNQDIYFNRSIDGGRSWLAQDIRLDSGSAGAAGSLLPEICCSANQVYVTWYDERNGEPDIYFNRSLDSGLTWLPADIRIDSGPVGSAASRAPSICCDGQRVHVAWHDDRNGTWDIYSNRSIDSGATWLALDVRVDRATGSTAARFPQIACSGSHVVCTWGDERQGGHSVLFNRSLNSGVSWEISDTILDNADSAGIPQMAVAGTHIHVVWTDTRGNMPHVRYNSSGNLGVAWLASDVQVDASAGGTSNPSVCAFDLDFFVVWQDTRSGAADIYFQRTRDRGATWLPNDARLDRDMAGSATSVDPVICCQQNNVHVAWRDARAGQFDILLRYSSDRGDNWSVPEVRMDTNPVGSTNSAGPEICCVGPISGVLWFDDRHAPGSAADIYFNAMDFTPGG